MKKMLNNPQFYFIAVPAFLLIWPISLWALYLPQAKKDQAKQQTQCDEIQVVIGDILKVDPERLDSVDANTNKNEFDYASAINRVAGSCGFDSQYYTLNTSAKTTTKGKTTQSASVSLQDVSITQFAKFISTIQIRWANLQCKSINLTQRKGQKDRWNIKLEFQYFF